MKDLKFFKKLCALRMHMVDSFYRKIILKLLKEYSIRCAFNSSLKLQKSKAGIYKTIKTEMIQ